MPGRIFCSSDQDYKFGFNGQEQDNEIYGKGNLTTAEFWEYDTRLGRRWNLDPIDMVSKSNYSCFNNNLIVNVDRLGNTPTIYMDEAGNILSSNKDNLDNRVVVIEDENKAAFQNTLSNAKQLGTSSSDINLNKRLRLLEVNYKIDSFTEFYDRNSSDRMLSQDYLNIDHSPLYGMPEHLSFNYLDEEGCVVLGCEDIRGLSLQSVQGDMHNADNPEDAVSRTHLHGVDDVRVIRKSDGVIGTMAPHPIDLSDTDFLNHTDKKDGYFNIVVSKDFVHFYNGYTHSDDGHKPKYSWGTVNRSFFEKDDK